jgi:hypothetical protein
VICGMPDVGNFKTDLLDLVNRPGSLVVVEH